MLSGSCLTTYPARTMRDCSIARPDLSLDFSQDHTCTVGLLNELYLSGLTLNGREFPVYGGLYHALTPTCGSQA